MDQGCSSFDHNLPMFEGCSSFWDGTKVQAQKWYHLFFLMAVLLYSLVGTINSVVHLWKWVIAPLLPSLLLWQGLAIFAVVQRARNYSSLSRVPSVLRRVCPLSSNDDRCASLVGGRRRPINPTGVWSPRRSFRQMNCLPLIMEDYPEMHCNSKQARRPLVICCFNRLNHVTISN